jgi:CheY-like chemotaxis protein
VTTTLLAVDDSVTMRKVLEITFAGENFKTLLASSADEAVQLAKRERPAVALVDHTLSEMSGYDLARELKNASPGIAVVVLSSKQTPFDKAKASATGVDDFMDKPFDTQKLLDKVAQVLSAPRAAAVAAAPMAVAPVQPAAAAAAAARPRPQSVTIAGTGVAPVASAPAPVASAPNRSFAGPAAGATPKPAAVQPMVAQPRPTAPAVQAAPSPRPAAAAAVASAVVATNGQLPAKLEALGLTKDQVQGVLALSREIVEKVVWEVVPVLAETMIKEEIKRLTSG